MKADGYGRSTPIPAVLTRAAKAMEAAGAGSVVPIALSDMALYVHVTKSGAAMLGGALPPAQTAQLLRELADAIDSGQLRPMDQS